MPSGQKLADQLSALQQRYQRALGEYETIRGQYEAAVQRVDANRNQLEKEERVGRSQARAAVRKSECKRPLLVFRLQDT